MARLNERLAKLEAIHRKRPDADMTDEEVENVLRQVTPEQWAELWAEHGALLSSWGYGRKTGQLEAKLVTQ